MDVIRGIAICGVVFPNILCLLDPDTFFEGVAIRWPEPHDRIALALVVGIFSDKMISVLTFLLGVGIAWQVRKTRKLGRSPRWFLVRRFLVLALLGAGNYVLLFEGDILIALSLTGIVAAVIVPSRLFARTNWVILGLWCYFVFLVSLTAGTYACGWSGGDAEGGDEAYHWYLYGTYDDTVYVRLYAWPYFPFITSLFALLVTLPPALLGALLYNLGLWQIAARSPRKMLRLFLWSAVPGLIMQWVSVVVTRGGARDPDPSNAVAAWLAGFTAWSPLLLALAYVLGLRMLLSAPKWLRRFSWFQYVGRLALSVYVMQNLLLGLLLYGYGAGLMEKAGPLLCIGIGLVLNAALIWAAKLYSSRFRQGPLEWIWRVLTYGWNVVKHDSLGAVLIQPPKVKIG